MPKRLGEGDQDGLVRRESSQQDHSEHGSRIRELQLRQRVAVQSADQGRDAHGRDGHDHRIPVEAVQADAFDSNAGLRPGGRPRLDSGRIGQEKDSAGLNVVHRLEGGQNHYDKRQKVEEDEEAQHAIGQNATDEFAAPCRRRRGTASGAILNIRCWVRREHAELAVRLVSWHVGRLST